MTINEALSWMRTLKERHAELVSLRNENSANVTSRYGIGGDKEHTRTPLYNVKALDQMVTRVAREIRRLDMQIKATNAVTHVLGYESYDEVLGDLADA